MGPDMVLGTQLGSKSIKGKAHIYSLYYFTNLFFISEFSLIFIFSYDVEFAFKSTVKEKKKKTLLF